MARKKSRKNRHRKPSRSGGFKRGGTLRRTRHASSGRHSSKRRARRGGGGKITLKGLISTLQKNGPALALAGGAILVARAVNGVVLEKAPTLHPALALLAGALAPGLGGVLVSGKAAVVIPQLCGGVGGALADIAAPRVAAQVAEYSPGAAAVILSGMSLEESGGGGLAPAPEPGTALALAGYFGEDIPFEEETGDIYGLADDREFLTP